MSLASILVTGGAGFIGSNLVLELQKRYPNAWITVVDDFRSGDYKNLKQFKGDVVAANMARLNWHAEFDKPSWDAVFHLAAVTDTTNHDQFYQIHDNVEGFRNMLDFLQGSQAPLVYASSAATYGIRAGANREDQTPDPANVYAFSKMVMDNLARHYAAQNPHWKLVGLKFFNVYGPREEHKGVPASMILHLARQIEKGDRPRIFRHGEQRRDFVYVKDVVNMCIAALKAPHSTLYNVGTGEPRSFNDLVGVLNKVLGTSYEPEYIDNPHAHYQPHTEADMRKTIAELNVKPEYSLEAGVRDYLDSGFLLLKK